MKGICMESCKLTLTPFTQVGYQKVYEWKIHFYRVHNPVPLRNYRRREKWTNERTNGVEKTAWWTYREKINSRSTAEFHILYSVYALL